MLNSNHEGNIHAKPVATLFTFDQVCALPIVQKDEKIFVGSDLSNVDELNVGIGANGTNQHALIRAFLIRSLESLRTIQALDQELDGFMSCSFPPGKRVLPTDLDFSGQPCCEDVLHALSQRPTDGHRRFERAGEHLTRQL